MHFFFCFILHFIETEPKTGFLYVKLVVSKGFKYFLSLFHLFLRIEFPFSVIWIAYIRLNYNSIIWCKLAPPAKTMRTIWYVKMFFFIYTHNHKWNVCQCQKLIENSIVFAFHCSKCSAHQTKKKAEGEPKYRRQLYVFEIKFSSYSQFLD